MKQNCGGDKKMKFSKLWVIFAVLGLFAACNPKSEFVEAPVGSSANCSAGGTVTTSAGAGTLFFFRLTSSIANTKGQNINNASLTVFTSQGQLQDPVSKQPLPSEFVSQTNDQGNIQFDIGCPSSGSTTSPSTCSVSFDYGTIQCSSLVTVTFVAP